jgi:hypothetical protein
MEWWRWISGSVAAVLVLALLALRFDTLKDLPGSSAPKALKKLAPFSLFVPTLFLLALLSPWWIGLIVIAVPGLTLLAMAAAD